MADTKFSDFTDQPVLTGTEYLVGVSGAVNFKVRADKITNFVLDPDNVPDFSGNIVGTERFIIQRADGAFRNISLASIKGYKSVFIMVNTSSGDAMVFGNNDFTGVTFTYSNPSNGTIRVTASSAIFTTGQTFVMTGGGADGGGVPFIVTAGATNTTFITIKLYKFDGTLTATPYVIVPIEIRVYP